jgi:hypothetical protein
MKIVPLMTLPSTKPFARTHSPKPAGYRTYRPCLRWEFGFTCALCLVHEADLHEFGLAEGWGLTWIEHRETQSSEPGKANDYSNCIYACRLCNAARNDKPLQDALGNRVLDPTLDAWADHFD